MKRCARCNRKRGLLERLLSFDNELCDECLFDIDEEIREKHAYRSDNKKISARVHRDETGGGGIPTRRYVSYRGHLVIPKA